MLPPPIPRKRGKPRSIGRAMSSLKYTIFLRKCNKKIWAFGEADRTPSSDPRTPLRTSLSGFHSKSRKIAQASNRLIGYGLQNSTKLRLRETLPSQHKRSTPKMRISPDVQDGGQIENRQKCGGNRGKSLGANPVSRPILRRMLELARRHRDLVRLL